MTGFSLSTVFIIRFSQRKLFSYTVGNKRFRILCELHEAVYVKANSKTAKSLIVMGIVDTIRESSCCGGFVKQVRTIRLIMEVVAWIVDGRDTHKACLIVDSFQDPFTKEWFEVSEAVAREKVGQQIRENMNRKKSGFKSASSAMRKRKSCSDDSSCQSEESEKSEVSSRRQSVESCNSESSELAVYSSQQCVSQTDIEQTTPDHTQIKESRQISPVSVANMAEWPQHQLSNMPLPLLEAEV